MYDYRITEMHLNALMQLLSTEQLSKYIDWLDFPYEDFEPVLRENNVPFKDIVYGEYRSYVDVIMEDDSVARGYSDGMIYVQDYNIIDLKPEIVTKLNNLLSKNDPEGLVAGYGKFTGFTTYRGYWSLIFERPFAKKSLRSQRQVIIPTIKPWATMSLEQQEILRKAWIKDVRLPYNTPSDLDISVIRKQYGSVYDAFIAMGKAAMRRHICGRIELPAHAMARAFFPEFKNPDKVEIDYFETMYREGVPFAHDVLKLEVRNFRDSQKIVVNPALADKIFSAMPEECKLKSEIRKMVPSLSVSNNTGKSFPANKAVENYNRFKSAEEKKNGENLLRIK